MKQSAIDKAPIQYFPLDRLYVSPMNPRTRTGSDWDGLRLLAESIKVAGLIQNLAGHLDEDGKVGIVAGGRRLLAMTELSPEDMASRRKSRCGLHPMKPQPALGPASKTPPARPCTLPMKSAPMAGWPKAAPPFRQSPACSARRKSTSIAVLRLPPCPFPCWTR